MDAQNKFYGVAKFNARVQIVLPKEARDDFQFSPKESLAILAGILPHSKDAFLLMKADLWYNLSSAAPIKDPEKHQFGGLVTLAERGQIVIPKPLRDQYHIQEGMQAIILSHEKTHSVIIALLNKDRIGEWANKMIEEEN